MIKSLYCVVGYTLIISALIHKLLKARSMKFNFFPFSVKVLLLRY